MLTVDGWYRSINKHVATDKALAQAIRTAESVVDERSDK
jgi:hypothetical protein